ncbi:MAG: SatD family protein [Carboxydocellales bacterium]
MKRITVITADVINSRENDLTGLKEKLGSYSHPLLIVPFTVSRGDEIQGVTEGWFSVPEVIRHLRNTCRPLKIKVGVGIGIIDEEKIDKDPWSMNGPPFHLARNALEDLKWQNSVTNLKTGVIEVDNLVKGILVLYDTIQTRWSEEQWQAVHVYEQVKKYEIAGEKLGKSWQAVQKNCKVAKWDQIKMAESALKDLEYLLDMIPMERKGENNDLSVVDNSVTCNV